MPFQRRDENEQTTFELTGEFTVCEVAALHSELLACLTSKSRVVIDLSQVTDCDTAGLQLLCAAHKMALARDAQLSLFGHSRAIRLAADRAGLDARVELGLCEEH